MKAKTVTIVGLDRVGGSIGLAIRASKAGLTVIGMDGRKGVRERAKDLGVIDKAISNLESAVSEADILVLNTTLAVHEAMMQAIGKAIRPHVVMLDLTRQKGQGLRLADEYMENGHYVGVVPVLAASMLSDSRNDLEAARVDLFTNSVFCYTPSVKADPVAVESAVSFGRILGASPFFLDANEFDSLLQGVETVPGLLAAALFQAVRKSRGWTDMLRFSGLSFATATADLENEDLAQLAFLDEEATLRWLDSVLLELGEIRRLVADGNKERLELLLQDLLGQRAVWLHRREENDWSEDIESPDIDTMTVRNQMFGGFLRRRKDDKKS